ncbi:MAG: tetratricopeptide repeat protein [Candidatus Zixiibacteriota bacterium]|nr:MAG: tetratricopeptide repeat protein [candidate division Zixibacteria bacterium]
MVHITFNVQEGEGPDLSEEYKVGHTYPVFILTDSEGEIIYRWTGYTGVRPFITSLNKALSDLTTVKDRIAQFEASPSFGVAVMLANYFSDTGEHLEAIDFFHRADALKPNPTIDYSYNIFSNTANAAWKGMIPFEDVLPIADTIVFGGRKNRNNAIKVARVMSRLARKLEKEGQVKKYLQAGIDLTANARDEKNKNTHNALKVEYMLQIEHDTVKAIAAQKSSLGPDWLRNPEKFYTFAKWCLERRVNLPEAEYLARQAAKYAQEGDFKAQVYNTVAELCYVQGKLAEAVEFADLAIGQDPGNTNYQDNQDRYLEEWEKR